MVTAHLLVGHRTDIFIVSYIIIILKTIKSPKASGCICFTFCLGCSLSSAYCRVCRCWGVGCRWSSKKAVGENLGLQPCVVPIGTGNKLDVILLGWWHPCVCAKPCEMRMPAEVLSTSRHEKQMEIAWVHLSCRALSVPAATASRKKGPREKKQRMHWVWASSLAWYPKASHV